MASFTSILTPTAVAAGAVAAPPDCCADLHLDQIISAVTAGSDFADLAGFFYAPLHDVAAVTYRHEVFRDLQRAQIRDSIDEFVTGMRTVRQRLNQSAQLWHPLQQQGWLIYAAQAYCDAMTALHHSLTQAAPAAPGLRGFAGQVARYVDGVAFATLAAGAADVQARLHSIRYAVHIHDLRVHVERYDGAADYSTGVAETFARFATGPGKDYRARFPEFPDMGHVEERILECVARLYPAEFALLDDFCTRNKHFIDAAVARFEQEIHFYLSYLDFIGKFGAAGLTFSYPEITTQPGVVVADGAFDLALADKSLRDGTTVVCNDFQLSGTERIFVVTGPNQGGKTTFAKTIGQCAYLASLGCPVPGTRAAFTLPDVIYTHFERQETLSTLHGKLDDELLRIHQILLRATAASMIVMNESFASTTVDDALLIGTEVLRRMARLRCVAVYVTFLDELSHLDTGCVSMVGDVAPDDPTRRTFSFTRRPADGLAYAAALADKYGLDHDALLARLAR